MSNFEKMLHRLPDPVALLRPDSSRTKSADEAGTIPNFFTLSKNGLLFYPPLKNGTPGEPMEVCFPSVIKRRGRELVMTWTDDDGVLHEWTVPRNIRAITGNAIAGKLEDAGLRCRTARTAHNALKLFLHLVAAATHGSPSHALLGRWPHYAP